MLGWLRLARTCASRWNRARAIRISREGVGEDLQRDLAVELRVGGLPDLAHAALAEEGGHVVVADRSAGTEGHELLSLLTGPFYAEPVHGSTLRRRSDRSGPGTHSAKPTETLHRNTEQGGGVAPEDGDAVGVAQPRRVEDMIHREKAWHPGVAPGLPSTDTGNRCQSRSGSAPYNATRWRRVSLVKTSESK